MMPSKRTINLGGCAIMDTTPSHKHRVAGKIEIRYNGSVKELTLSVRAFRNWNTRSNKLSAARCEKLNELSGVITEWLEANGYQCQSPGRFYTHGVGKKRDEPESVQLFKI
jgi:hypothetical protein